MAHEAGFVGLRCKRKQRFHAIKSNTLLSYFFKSCLLTYFLFSCFCKSIFSSYFNSQVSTVEYEREDIYVWKKVFI